MPDHSSPANPDHRSPNAPLRHVKHPVDFEKIALPILGAAATLMLFLSTLNLMTDSGPAANLKALLIAASGGLVAYGVNRLSIERGAPLAAIGFSFAGILSVTGILVVGAAMFASTFSGLVLKDVGYRQLQDNGTSLAAFAGARNRANLVSARVGPALAVVSRELSGWAECEIARNCLSGREGGGRGPVAMMLEGLAGKAAAIAEQFAAGQSAADRALAGLNAANADYQKGLNGDDADLATKQAELLKIHGRIEQQASALAEAIPVALVRAYATELAAGATVPGNPEVTQRVNAILAGHAKSLSEISASGNEAEARPPVFPRRPGVADTLRYIPEFVSIAGVVFVAEMVLPLTMWVWCYLRLSWRLEQAEAGSLPPALPPPSILPPPASNRDEFGGLIRLPTPAANEQARQARRRRPHGGRR